MQEIPMRLFALLTTIILTSVPAIAENQEWRMGVQEVFAFPIECPKGEYSTSVARIVEVEGKNITLRPDQTCVKEGHVYLKWGFIAPDGKVYFPFPDNEDMDPFVLDFLTQQ